MREQLKNLLFKLPTIEQAAIAFRRTQLHSDYTRRREYYAAIAHERGLVYHEESVISAIHARLANRGYTPTPRQTGDVHTFAFIPRIGWHSSLYSDLRELGPVSEYDYIAEGYPWKELTRRDTVGTQHRLKMRAAFFEKLRQAHAQRPVDWVYVYAHGNVITSEIIRHITEELGVPVVNMCLDDKQSWRGPEFDGQRSGQVDIAEAFDISWTTARVACEWYLVEGANPIYIPEGFDLATYRPMTVQQDIPVSFVGAAYGYRPLVIRYLQKYAIPIQVFGSGWPQSHWVNNIVEIFNRSVVNLGMGGIIHSESLTNVKGRDFEIPATGGGVYLTSFNPDLALHFVVGKEIVCYRNHEELIELVRYYLAHPEEARAIAQKGYVRCLREHRWLHRYQRICQILGILSRD